MNRDMDRDNFEEIINGEDTYKAIAKKLLNGESVLIGWTDEICRHFDILFTLGAYRHYHNTTQGGIRPTDLFISIMKWGSFGFDTEYEKSPGYYAEKLFMQNESEETIKKLGTLFNNVIKYLNKG